MKHNKLVRDKIPEIIRKEGKIPVVRIASDKEYWTKLKEKLREEVEEFAKEENKEELVDILEVFNAICAFRKFNKSELEILRKNKQETKGGFKEKIILEETN